MICVCLLPIAANAEEKEKTVRVGWYDAPVSMIDQYGRRSGHAYEYQAKLAAYTGWNYEYVEDSWPNLLQMLIDGEIDMLSDVSYTEERSENMLFPHLPMGEEDYYIFISPDNKDYIPDDYSYFDGKRSARIKAAYRKRCIRIGKSQTILSLSCLKRPVPKMSHLKWCAKVNWTPLCR